MDPQLEQLLSQLRDIHSPTAVSWWPLAPGWWLLLVLALAGIVGVIAILLRRQHMTLYKREGLALLDEAYQQWQADENAALFLGQCAQLLRRVLVYRQGRGQVAPLSGTEWRSLLASTAGPTLSEPSLDALVVQQYRRQPEFDSELLYLDLRGYLSQLEPATRV